MEREIPQSADQPPGEKRPIAHGLEELRTVLGELARLALTSSSEVMKLTREDFQSPTYQKAGYGAMPERYGTSDRYVYTLEYADGTQLIIFGGKFAPARRFAGDPVPDPLADNRESSNFIYNPVFAQKYWDSKLRKKLCKALQHWLGKRMKGVKLQRNHLAPAKGNLAWDCQKVLHDA
jgi:hypothetical protein